MAAMSDMERIEKLSSNLTHPIVDVRLRAAQNLQFKLLSNVLGDGIYTSSSCMRTLADGMSGSLNQLISGDDWHLPTTPTSKVMEEILQLAQLIGKKSNLAPEAANSSFANLLEKLYAVISKCPNGSPTHKLCQQAIEGICTIKSPNVEMMLSSATSNDFNPVPAHLLQSPLTKSVLFGSAGPDQAPNEKLQRGAGAILQSALVYSGWKFAKIVLTDSDERYLFDTEVRVKLGHDTSVQLLWDCLSDFPAPALISRPGLMAAVLDLVGAVYTQDQLASNPGGLNPLTAMAWLEVLLKKCVSAFVMQMEGSLCGTIPTSSQTYKPVDDVGSIEHGKPSLAAQMTKAMYSLRYPVLPGDAEADAEAELQKAAASAPLRVSPAPSLPGLAFAACAAALPLLQGRDPQVGAQALSLIKTALPYIREPSVAAAAGDGTNGVELAITDRKRMQHLLNRIEQLLCFFESTPLSVDHVLNYCLSLSDEEKAAADISEEKNTVARVQQAASDATLLRALVEILLLTPVGSVRPVPDIATDADRANDSLLDIGTLSLSVAQDLIASGRGSSQLLERGEDSSIEAALSAIVRRADPAAMDGIEYASELLQSVASLHEMAELDETARNAPSKFLLEKLLEKAHVVVNLLDCGSDALLSEMSVVGRSIPETAVVLLAAAISQCADHHAGMVLRDSAVVSAVSLITRLACCCGSVIRIETYSCLLGILTAGQSRELSSAQVDLLGALKFKSFPLHNLLGALATPNFLQSLVLFGLLGADAADLSYGIDNVPLLVSGSEPPVPQAMTILEHLLTFTLTNSGLDVAAAATWCVLLCPLKVCEWGLAANPLLRTPQAVLSFITLLEDCCAASEKSSKARTAYGLALSLGLFHCMSDVRSRCAVRLRYELAGLKAGAYDYESAAAMDPFAENKAYPTLGLASWGALQSTESPKLTSGSSAFVPTRLMNHSECRKLASIAFGSHDAVIRTTAMRQLLQMLADRHLMATAEGGWCVSVAAKCAAILSSVHWEDSDAGNGKGGLVDAKLALEAASLLRTLMCESGSVRAAAIFWPVVEDDASPLDVSIWPLLNAILRPAQAQRTITESQAVLCEVQVLCAQTLVALCHDASRWGGPLSTQTARSTVLTQSGFEIGYTSVPVGFTGGSGGCRNIDGATSLQVPVFLSAAFNYVISYSSAQALGAGEPPSTASSADENRAYVRPFDVTVMRCEVGDRGSGRARQLPTKHTMSRVARAANSPPAGALLATAAAALCASLATADSHRSMRSLLQAVGGLGLALPDLFGALVVEDLRLALGRLLSVPPRSRNDTVTLAAALTLLATVVRACTGYHKSAVGKGGEAYWEVASAASVLLEDVIEACLAPLFPLLTDFKEASAGPATALLSPAFTSRDHVMRDENVEDVFARQQAQHAILDLLEAVCAVPYPLLSLRPMLEGHALPHVLVQMLSSELLPSWKRAKAATILESLLTLHDSRILLTCGVTDDEQWDGLAISVGNGAVSMDLILRAIKLLRTPDSFRGNGPTIAALRVFYTCVTQFSAAEQSSSSSSSCTTEESRWWRRVRDWGWIMRLGWDRRGEIRMLTMSVLQALLPLLPEVQGKSLAITVDSLEGHSQAVGHSVGEWPPVTSLLHVMLDCSEAHGIRAVAMQTLLACSTSPGVSTTNGSIDMQHFLAAALDLLGVPSTQFARLQGKAAVSASSSSAALTALLDLLITCPFQEAVEAAKGLRVLPKLLELLRSDLRADLQHASLYRVGLVTSKDETVTSMFPTSHTRGFGAPSSPDRFCSGKHYYLSSGGWESCWTKYLHDSCEVSGSLLQAGACRVANQLTSMFAQSGLVDTFAAAARQCSLAKGLMSILCSGDFLLESGASSPLVTAADRKDAAVADLLYSFISHGQGMDQVASLLQSDPTTAGLLLRRMTFRLDQVLLNLPLLTQSTVSYVSSSLRILCALLDNTVFVAMLDELDWPAVMDGCPTRPSPVNSMTQALLRLRVEMFSFSSSDSSSAAASVRHALVLGPRLDVAIGLWCQRFESSRGIMHSAVLSGPHGGVCPLLDHYVEILESAAAEMTKNATAPPPPRDQALRAQQSSDIKRSLATLKKRTRGSPGPIMTKNVENTKWRDQARGYTWPAHCTKPNPSLSAASRLAAWSSLVALSGCLAHPAATSRAVDMELQTSLGQLVRLVGSWAAMDQARVSSGTKSWAPSHADVANAVLAACCTFTQGGHSAKQALAGSGDAIATLRASGASNGQSAEGNMLHHLVNLGLSGAVPASSRWLLLSLSASLLRTQSSPAVQKAALAHVLSSSLQRALSCKNTDAEVTPHLLNALSACLLAEAAGGSVSVGRDITNSHNTSQIRASSPIDSDLKHVALPQLISWISESYTHRPDILAAAVRCLAALATAGTSDGIRGPAFKRLFSIAGSTEPMRLIVNATDNPNPSLAALASLALWVMLHGSSQALATAKAIVAPASLADFITGKKTAGPFGPSAIHAKQNLLSLLQHNSV